MIFAFFTEYTVTKVLKKTHAHQGFWSNTDEYILIISVPCSYELSRVTGDRCLSTAQLFDSTNLISPPFSGVTSFSHFLTSPVEKMMSWQVKTGFSLGRMIKKLLALGDVFLIFLLQNDFTDFIY
jgi:hypothetical protein